MQRVDPRRAVRRDEAGHDRGADQDDRHQRKTDGIARPHPEQRAGEQPGQRRRTGETDHDADRREPQAASDHLAKDLPASRAEGEPDADLAAPADPEPDAELAGPADPETDAELAAQADPETDAGPAGELGPDPTDEPAADAGPDPDEELAEEPTSAPASEEGPEPAAMPPAAQP